MKQKIIKLLLLATLLFQAGCGWDMREIDHRSMILGLGIDKGREKKYSVSIQLPVLSKGKGSAGSKDFEVFTSEGDTLWEAMTSLESQTPTVLFFGQLKVITISEEVARAGIKGVLDLIDRVPDIGNKVYLLISRGQKAKAFIDADSPLINLPSLYLNRYFRAEQKVARSKDIRVFEYRRDREITSHSAIIPLAKSEGEIVVIEGMAVMRNHKMVDTLSANEVSPGILLKENRVEGMNFVLSVPYQEEEIPVSLTRVDLEAEINHEKKNPVEFEINVKGSGEITEVLNGHTSRDFITKIEKAFNKQFEKELRKTIEKMQATNVDPWLLGHRIMINDKDFFDSLNWEEEGFQHARFTVNVDLSIDLMGQRGVFGKEKLEDKE